MMYGCKKCTKMGGFLMLALGIAFLGVDLNYWGFFGIQWYTALFILFGVAKLGSECCRDCQLEKKKGR